VLLGYIAVFSTGCSRPKSVQESTSVQAEGSGNVSFDKLGTLRDMDVSHRDMDVYNMHDSKTGVDYLVFYLRSDSIMYDTMNNQVTVVPRYEKTPTVAE
jgi:hypothetical protein